MLAGRTRAGALCRQPPAVWGLWVPSACAEAQKAPSWGLPALLTSTSFPASRQCSTCSLEAGQKICDRSARGAGSSTCLGQFHGTWPWVPELPLEKAGSPAQEHVCTPCPAPTFSGSLPGWSRCSRKMWFLAPTISQALSSSSRRAWKPSPSPELSSRRELLDFSRSEEHEVGGRAARQRAAPPCTALGHCRELSKGRPCRTPVGTAPSKEVGLGDGNGEEGEAGCVLQAPVPAWAWGRDFQAASHRANGLSSCIPLPALAIGAGSSGEDGAGTPMSHQHSG